MNKFNQMTRLNRQLMEDRRVVAQRYWDAMARIDRRRERAEARAYRWEVALDCLLLAAMAVGLIVLAVTGV